MAKRIFYIIIIFLAILIIGIFDILTGRYLSFSIFYLFPILFSTWNFGIIFGIIIALISTISWSISELITWQFDIGLFILFWNATVRLGYFVISLSFLSAFKKELNKERTLSRVDFLTGVANSKSFFERADIERSRCRRSKAPFTIAYLDCDYFKTVNDIFGHKRGDAVLKIIASVIQANIRITDVAARIGGDEFVILLPETGKEVAEKVISRTQNQLLEQMKKNNWLVTFSIGVVTFINPLDSVDDMVGKADSLMYAAKADGRNLINYAEFM